MVHNGGKKHQSRRTLLSPHDELARRAESRPFVQNSCDRLQLGRGSCRLYGKGSGASEGKVVRSASKVRQPHISRVTRVHRHVARYLCRSAKGMAAHYRNRISGGSFNRERDALAETTGSPYIDKRAFR